MNVVWSCYAHPYTAMGVIANNVIIELTKLGYNISYEVLNKNEINLSDYPPEVQKAINQPYSSDTSIAITFAYPDIYREIKNKLKCKVSVGYTGCDSSGGYLSSFGNPWSTECNEFCDYMLTPSNYSKEIMKNLGVKKDIYLFPHGVDLNIFKPIKRSLSKPITFVFTGELTKRKSVQDIIIAFLELTGKDNPDFKLLLRANSMMQYLQGNEIIELAKQSNNITIDWKNEGQQDLVSYMNKGHVYMCCTRADWYNMTIFEAMSTSCPIIATENNGYYEFLKDYIIPVKYTSESISKNDHPYLLGQWSSPNKEDIKRQMKYVIENYEYESNKSFYEASPYIHENFSWKAVTKQYLVPFLEMVEEKHFKNERKTIDFKRIICPYYKDFKK